jgi:hypothetical protein
MFSHRSTAVILNFSFEFCEERFFVIFAVSISVIVGFDKTRCQGSDFWV